MSSCDIICGPGFTDRLIIARVREEPHVVVL